MSCVGAKTRVPASCTHCPVCGKAVKLRRVGKARWYVPHHGTEESPYRHPIKQRAERTGYNVGRKWTPAEEQFVRDNCATMTDGEIAATMDRTRRSVAWRRINVLNISHSKYPKELREIIHLTNQLKRKIHERETKHR